MLINKWQVGKSILFEGIPVPYFFQSNVLNSLDRKLEIGESLFIHILIDELKFKVKIQNQKFNRRKYQDHVPIIRILYGKSDFSDFLKTKFNSTHLWLESQKKLDGQYPRINHIPHEIKEYFILETTERKNEFRGKCLKSSDITVYHEEIKMIQDEELAEMQLNYSHIDKKTGLLEKQVTAKIRQYDKKLIDNLKNLYNFQCQICRKKFFNEYTVEIAEAHHIKPFIESFDNDSDNLLILCPNHHRLIHKAKPKFSRRNLLFRYPNGYEEKLLLNRHLRSLRRQLEGDAETGRAGSCQEDH